MFEQAPPKLAESIPGQITPKHSKTMFAVQPRA